MAKSTFSLSDFKASIKANGVARNTRFELVLHPPLQVTSVINSREISIRCHTGALPHMRINTKDFYVGQGQLRKMPVNYDHGHELDFTFYNDTRSKVYDGLLQWTNAVLASKEENNYSLSYFEDYVGTLEIKQLDEQDNVRYSYVLYDVYPTLVDSITLDSSNTDTAQLVKVRFSYRYARTWDDIVKDELTTIIEKNKDIGSLMSSDYLTRSRVFDSKSTEQMTGAARNRVYTSSEFDSTMIESVVVKRGQGLTPTQSYNQCLNFAMATRAKGETVKTNQTSWTSTSTQNMDSAIASDNHATIQSAWGAVQNSYGQVTSATNSFFSDSANAVYQYDFIKNSVPVGDPLHTEMSQLNATYSGVAANQIGVNTTYSTYEGVVNNIINPQAIVMLA